MPMGSNLNSFERRLPNIRMINIKIFNTYRSALALEAVDGGFIDGIVADSFNIVNTGHAVFMRIGERVSGKKGRLENIKIDHLTAEIAANKPDSGYEYEGPIEDMPRNISPAVIIVGLPGALINGVTLTNIVIRHPGGANPLLARISLNELDSVPEKPAGYPEFSMFKELPSWGAYIRHARGIQFSNVSLTCGKKDYRIALVLDDVQDAKFNSIIVKEPANKKPFYQYRSTGIVFK
jgi:hypothetical protein